MKLNITIPDEMIPALREQAIAATREEGRTISITTLAGQYAIAAIASELDVAALASSPVPEYQATAEPRHPGSLPSVQLHPVTRPTFGPLGGARLEEQADVTGDLERAQAQLLRARAREGLDATGLAPEQATTRAAVQGTGPRPMGDLPDL
jgi:hypothetical protein